MGCRRDHHGTDDYHPGVKTYTCTTCGATKTETVYSQELNTLVVKAVGDYDTLHKDLQVQAIFEDGTVKNILVKAVGQKIGDKQGDDGVVNVSDSVKPEARTLYTYVEEDGSYTLTPLSEHAWAGNMGLTADTNASYDSDRETIGGKEVEEHAVIYICYNRGTTKHPLYTYKALDGTSIHDYHSLTAGGNSVCVSNQDGKVIYAFIDLSDKDIPSQTLYGVVTDAYLRKNTDGKQVVYMDLLTADGKKEGIETAQTQIGSLNAGDIVKFNGDYTFADDVMILSDGEGVGSGESAGYGAVNSYNSTTGLVTFYNAAAAKVVGNTVVIYVDESFNSAGNWTVESDGSITSAEQLTNSTYKANGFYYVNNEDSEMALLVVDIQGELKDDDGKLVTLNKKNFVADTQYAYVTETPVTIKDSDDNEVTQMTLWNGTKEVTLTCDDKYEDVEKGSFVSYEVVDDEATNVEVKDSYVNAVKSYNKTTGRISFYENLPEKLDGQTINYCKLVKDSQIIYVNVDNEEGLESGSIIQANEVVGTDGNGTGTYTYNVIVVQDDENKDEIAAIFVETDNDLGLGATTKQ
jgi:hypothetical protein